MINCVVIDDEPLARECISSYVDQLDFLHLSGIGSNPVELTHLLDTHTIELVFLDIQMPVMSGIDFLRIAKKPPMVIITTAYPNYALEGFQLDVLDYLVKPITFERFFKAVNKAKDYYELLKRCNVMPAENLNAQGDYFFIKCDYKYEKINRNEILFIQALQNYITIHTAKGKYLTLLNLKNIHENLAPQTFIRVHKSYIVSIPHIDAIENNEIIIKQFRIPIGRGYRDEVIERVIRNRLLKKADEQ